MEGGLSEVTSVLSSRCPQLVPTHPLTTDADLHLLSADVETKWIPIKVPTWCLLLWRHFAFDYFGFCKVPFIVIIFLRRSLWNPHNPVSWITEHLQSFSRLPAAYLDLMFAAATSFCGLPRYCTLLFSWKTHTIKLCPLPEGTSKYNCYKGDVFVCSVLQEILHQFQQNCRNLRSSSSKPTTAQKPTTAPTRRENQALLWLLCNTGVSADCAKFFSSGTPGLSFLKGIWHSYNTHCQKTSVSVWRKRVSQPA